MNLEDKLMDEKFQETAEEIFFKYAFPCANVLVDMKAISQERYETLKKMFEEGSIPDKKVLEDTFKAAFRRLESLAREMRIKDYWDKRVIEEYWRNGNHNINIDSGEGNYSKFPEVFNDFCKVHIAEVVEIKPPMAIVKYGSKNRPVFTTLVPNLRVGEKVRIHHAYAVEKV